MGNAACRSGCRDRQSDGKAAWTTQQLCLCLLSVWWSEEQHSCVPGPGASQPPAVVSLPASQVARVTPTCLSSPGPMCCPLARHAEEPHLQKLYLSVSYTPNLPAPTPFVVQVLSLVVWFLCVVPWSLQSQIPSVQCTQPSSSHTFPQGAAQGPWGSHSLCTQPSTPTTMVWLGIPDTLWCYSRPNAIIRGETLFTVGHLWSRDIWISF